VTIHPHDNSEDHSPHGLLTDVAGLRDYLLELCECAPAKAERVHDGYVKSAKNLLQYVALRHIDVRPLQERLILLGLSSLGRAEPHVMASIDAVFESLQRIVDHPNRERKTSAAHVSVQEGRALLDKHTNELLGPKPHGRSVRIMVTLPSEAAAKPELIQDLLAAGTDCVRINCAHDDASIWSAMIHHVREAERAQKRGCKILMDLGGPKLRTGPLCGVQVVRCRVERNPLGRITAPARVVFIAQGTIQAGTPPNALAVPAEWLSEVRVGDLLLLQDARGRTRRLEVVEAGEGRCTGECFGSCYITRGSRVTLKRPAERGGPLLTEVGELPEVELPLLLKKGDFLRVTRSLEPGSAARVDDTGRVLSEAHIGCTLPDVFSQAKCGERIWFDDGKIGGILREANANFLRVEITHAAPSGSKLRSDKGINLPDSALHLSALTAKDLSDLPFVAQNADMIGFSFVQDPADVLDLRQRVLALTERPVGIVLKVETKRAFEHLPELLLAAMQGPLAGVMIARGDLAIECGFERMAEVQEEILWICEAAHVPAIWATQVLESVAKTGLPSRAEITDAAMGVRAECVMLNKGPYILEAVRILDDVLSRMQEHQNKKRALLRKLTSWTVTGA